MWTILRAVQVKSADHADECTKKGLFYSALNQFARKKILHIDKDSKFQLLRSLVVD